MQIVNAVAVKRLEPPELNMRESSHLRLPCCNVARRPGSRARCGPSAEPSAEGGHALPRELAQRSRLARIFREGLIRRTCAFGLATPLCHRYQTSGQGNRR